MTNQVTWVNRRAIRRKPTRQAARLSTGHSVNLGSSGSLSAHLLSAVAAHTFATRSTSVPVVPVGSVVGGHGAEVPDFDGFVPVGARGPRGPVRHRILRRVKIDPANEARRLPHWLGPTR